MNRHRFFLGLDSRTFSLSEKGPSDESGRIAHDFPFFTIAALRGAAGFLRGTHLCLMPHVRGGVILAGMDEKRELLRHTLAALAYRTTRALEGAPAEFGAFDGAGRKPVEILAHMGDLFDWALSLVEGLQRWKVSQPLDWPAEKMRFFAALSAFDAYLASGAEMHGSMERLMQGPVADALTHVGQLAMLRRLAGCPADGENFYLAAVAVGLVGAEQPAPVKPF
jgi:hypothetical protein